MSNMFAKFEKRVANVNEKKRTSPLLAKMRAAAKATETVTGEAVKPKANPLKNMFRKKKTVEKTEEAAAMAAEAEAVMQEEKASAVVEEKAEAKEEPAAKTVEKPEETAAEAPAEQKEESKAEEPAAETVAESAPAEEAQKETKAKDKETKEAKAEAEEPKAEEAAEEKPAAKPKRKRRTHAEVVAEREAKAAAKKKEEEAAKSNVPATADEPDTDDAGILVSDYREVNAFDTTMTPEEAAGIVNQGLVSTSFRAYQREIIDRVKDIRIAPDMNPGSIKYMLAELDGLNVEVGLQLTEKKQLINAWTNKEYGVLTAYRISHAVGKNEGERKRNAFAALSAATINGQQVNVLALITSANIQLEFFQGISDLIKAKREMLITMSSQVKLENSSMMIQDAIA